MSQPAGNCRASDWSNEDYQRFLCDPEVPAIARELALREPPVAAEAVAQYDS
jgi:hypothetical protein